MNYLTAVSLSWLVLLCGCSSREVLKPEVDIAVPETYSTTPAHALRPPTEWWTEFKSDVLNQIEQQVLDANPDLQAAAARIQAARAQARIAGADLAPNLGFGFGVNHQRSLMYGIPLPGAGDGVESKHTTWGANLSVSWEIDLWDRIGAGARAATHEALARTAEAHDAANSLSAQTAKIYIQLLENTLQQKNTTTLLALREKDLRFTQQRYQRGILSHDHILAAESDYSAVQQSQAFINMGTEQLRRQLDILCGSYPLGQLTLDHETLPALPPAVDAGQPAELIDRRPDIRAARERLFSSGAQLQQHEGSLYPQISISAQAGTSTTDFDRLLDKNFAVWNLAANIFQPIFNHGKLVAGVDMADAQQHAALYHFQSTCLKAWAEVETLLANEQHLWTALQHSRQQQTLAQQRLTELRMRYERGQGSLHVLYNAESVLLQAQSQELSNHRQILETRIDLYLALGGAFPTAVTP